MSTVADGVEVVESRKDAAGLALPPLLVLDAVREFFDAHRLGRGPLEVERIGDGQSNVTYRITRGDKTFVLRRGPRPPHPKSAHNMVREARIQRLVRAAGVPVPRIVAVCEDDSTLDVPFYVMEFVGGEVITNRIPPQFDGADQRRATAFAAIDAMVALHRVDVRSGELATLGRPDGYLERQVRLFSSLWDGNTRRELPEVAVIGAWLAANRPESQMVSVVHGDFRLGNLMFNSSPPVTVAAILDWEMATIGDPLADLGYFAATYAEPGTEPTPMDLTPVTREPGYPSREELLARYARQLPLDLSQLHWYQALALWKAAIFCEAMYTRWHNGERPGDDFGPTLEEGVPALLRAASSFARN
ncbi:phosphotransferase family protein [Specibacter sp. RAF43]|uniref:phosphotransferase family protein n=1 Tax=Specibacter sp. RAF43 TaxID=3233057 RepID=UPI003F9A481E